MIDKLFSHLRLRFLNFTSQTINYNISNNDRMALALVWFKHTLLPEGGSSAKYSMLFNKFFPAYPETTGFWINTLLALQKNNAALYNEIFPSENKGENVIDSLASWLISVQRLDGTFPGSYGDFENQPPRVFNNGQIILGLLDYYQHTKSDKALTSALESAKWLLKVQSNDGGWRQFTMHQLSSNTRTGYALIRLGQITGEKKFTDAGRANIEFALALQKSNGYFKDNGFNDFEVPTTHTIAYAMHGILCAAIDLQNDEWIKKLSLAYENIGAITPDDGLLPGQLNDDWQTDAHYCCLAGNCQLASVGYLLSSHTANKAFADTASRLLEFVKTKQLVSQSPYVNGGISGSWPVSGGYCAYDIPNWAACFFVDALMLQNRYDNK